MKIALPMFAAALAATGFAAVATTAQTGTPADAARERVRQVIVYGNDPCPDSFGDEIVVCARRPDGDRYRIPEELRTEGTRGSQSWAERAESLEYVGASGIQSCSTVGPGGYTGCWNQMVRDARNERRRPPR